jgi:hypothetical protein
LSFESLYFAFTSVFEQLYNSLLLEIEPWTRPLCRLWCEDDIKLIQSWILINAVNYSLTFRETWIRTKRVLILKPSLMLELLHSATSILIFLPVLDLLEQVWSRLPRQTRFPLVWLLLLPPLDPAP